MTITLGDIKKLCKEKGVSFRAASLFGASKIDSGKCDLFIETADKYYAVKLMQVGDAAERVYFNSLGGGYISVKEKNSVSDYAWVKPNFDKNTSGKETVCVLLLDSDVPATLVAKNSAMVVTSGAGAFGCKVYTPSAFVKLF